MMRLLPVSLVAFCLAAPAAADKFHLGSADDAKKLAEGSSPSVIEGVLLEEKDGNYVIRVDGGEIRLAKASVHKIEKDGLTVADLEKREKDASDRLAEANVRRSQLQAAEASATREARNAAAARSPEMPESIVINVDFNGLLPSYAFRTGYDPVLHRADLSGLAGVVEAYLRDELARVHHRAR
jgi:hypothetical protein